MNFTADELLQVALVELAKKLPTGIIDPKALEKMEREMAEYFEAIPGSAAAAAEAADVIYYEAKARENGLSNEYHLGYLLRQQFKAYFTPKQLVLAVLVKYTMRAAPGNPKDVAKENEAIAYIALGQGEGTESMEKLSQHLLSYYPWLTEL